MTAAVVAWVWLGVVAAAQVPDGGEVREATGAEQSSGPARAMVDRVIAVVDKEAITESQLVTQTRVALALRSGEEAASGEISADLLDAFLVYVIDQVLISNQARRMASLDVPDNEVEERYRQFAGSFRSGETLQLFLRRFDISESSLKNIFRRDLRNERYIDLQMRARLVTSGKAGVASMPEQAREAYEQALKRWLVELRSAAEIRRLGPSGVLEVQHGP